MALDPDIQKHFDFKYVEGELHMFVSKDLVEALGWTEKDIKLAFGNIERMNSFKGANLTITADNGYEHPWYKDSSQTEHTGRQRDMDAL